MTCQCQLIKKKNNILLFIIVVFSKYFQNSNKEYISYSISY